ncbi:MAG: PaaI family thioesterase [Pyrinomonadaceae bacterium MAG19_C2-C3]|nr:PaaI family thioesterase [Pyrinomonadaceae bacterium MAG19_C2-C3]
MSETRNRTRIINWEEPRSPAELGKDLSGLEFLQKMMAGEVPRPPISLLMNFALTELSEGSAVFTCEPDEYHYNPLGTIHGGLAATVLDSAMACAVHSTLPAGVAYTTLEIKINYVRPMTVRTGVVRGEARVIHTGGRVATAEGKVVDANGKLYAHGTTTCMIFRA